MNPPILRTVLSTALSALLLLTGAGCVSIPADPGVLPQQDLARAQLAASIKLTQGDWPDVQWWTRYDDPQLNRLMARALKNSPTLQAAAARVGSAHAVLQRNYSEQGLNAALSAGADRTRYSSNGFFPPPIGGAYYTETTITATAQYDFDWWGKHRAAIAAALGEVNARQAEYAQAQQTLCAAVAQSYFALQGAWARLANLQHIADDQRQLLADDAKRVAHGIAAIDTEHKTEVELDLLTQYIAQLETMAAREREALRALLGADAQALTDLAPRPLPQMPSALPAELGIELLARRPDLQAARWRVEAALDRIDAAKAAFYPDLSISGFIGTDVISIDQLFQYGSRTMSIAPTLSLPLFDSGRLQAGLGIARTQRNEMIADYNQTVFVAVREVAQEAAGLQGLQKQMAAQDATKTAALAILHSVQARYDHGLADRSTLLNGELTVAQLLDINLQLQSQTLQTDVALIRALGGGYRASPTFHDSGASTNTNTNAPRS